MLDPSCPKSRNYLDSATVMTPFSSGGKTPFGYCVVHCPCRLTAALLSLSAKFYGNHPGPAVWRTVMLSFRGDGRFGAVWPAPHRRLGRGGRTEYRRNREKN